MFSRICVSFAIAAACASTNAADEQSQVAQHSKNLVTNPSLEENVVDSELPPGWGSFYPKPAGSYTYSIVDGGRTGKKSMLIEGDGTFGVLPANRIEIDRSKRYVVRGWVKIEGDEDATADVKFHYYAADGRYMGQTRVGYVRPTSDDWQFITVTDQAPSFPEVKYVGLAFAATGKVKARYDDLELIAFNKETLPLDFENEYGVTRSPQLALLGRRIGNWTTETTINPCVWVPDGSKSKGVETIRWALGGQFIEGRAKNLSTGIDSLFLMTFDGISKKYRFWHFDSQGNFPKGESIGSWDDATQTFTFEATDDNDVRFTSWLKLIDNDAVEWSGTWTDKERRVLLDMEATITRKRE